MGTTNSFDNTPQAADDIFTLDEDTKIITLNVMANDLGGNAKTLYSIDDGTTSSGAIAPTDLLIKDAIGGNSDVSAKGARISITADGKVSYDLSSVAEFQKLAAGEKGEDSFIYAIRLGNGTLSWARAVIVVIGVNDAPQILSIGTTATGAITESAGQTGSSASDTASGKIAFADVDLKDTHSASVGAAVFKWSGGTLSTEQSAALQAASTLQLTMSDSTTTGSGSVGWSYNAKDMAFDFLSKDQTLTVTYQVSVADKNGGTVVQNVVITVTGTNDAPVAVADTGSGTENQTVSIDVLANDTDADNGHVLTLVSGTAPTSKGSVAVANNQLVFTPGTDFDHLKAGATEQVTLSYTMKDDQGATSTSSVVVTVTGTNDAPVAVADTASGTENQTLAIDVLANDTDADDGHVFTLLSGTAPTSKGSVAVANNQLVFTPGTDFDHLKAGATEQVTLNYTMKDDQGATSTSSVVVTVTGTNDAPVAVADTASGTENQALSIDVLANDTDVDDGHVFTLISGTAPANKGTVTVANNQLVFTPGTDFDHLKVGATEQLTLNYTMKDDQGATSTSSVVVTVTGTNDAPVAVADTASGTENQALSIDVLANDTDADDGHVFTLVSGTAPASKGSVAVANNQLVFTPGADFDHLKAGATEQVSLNYTMKDDQGATSTSSVVVTVTGTNDAPVAVADTASGTENQTLAIDVLANDTDADDGHVFTLLSVTAPANKGSVAVANNQLVFTPGADFDHLKAGATEQVTLNYTMKDDQGATSTSSVVVTVTGTNDAPVAVADTASGTENQTLAIDVLANDTDADDGHVFTLVSGTAPANKGTVTVANNQLVFTLGSDFDHLKAGATEQVTLSYTMKDDQGATSTSSVVVTVTGTNDAPVAVADTASGTENQALSIDVLANDTDADDGHVFTLLSGTAPANKGTVTVANNQLVFTPGADFDHLKAGATEQVTLNYTMKDDQGATSTSSVVVTVTGTNDAPVAVADTASATENQTVSIDVLANDTDADDGYVFTLVSGTAPANKGTVTVANNQLVFTPGTDFDHLKAGVSEQVTVSYTMKDDQGVESTSSVVVTVTGTNDAPVAVADTASGTENQALSIDVLANDTDADDGHVFTLVSGTAPANKGTVTVANNQLVFTPGSDFDHLKAGATEQVTLNYTMKDDQGATSTSSVVVTVTGTNDAPVAVADTASGTENQTVSIDVLANDTDADDGHVFTLVSGTAPEGKGTTSVVDNQLVFIPGADFDHLKAGASEQVTLNYTMKDDQGVESTSSVVVTVTGTNDAPVAVADTASGTENQTLAIDVLANDTDVDDGHVFTLVSGTAPEGKGATSVVDNKLVFTPGTDFDHLKAGVSEQVTLSYTMKDDQGVESTSSVVVTVTGTNDAPVAVADTASGTENQTLAIDVLANDTDVDDGHVFTLVSGTAPEGKGATSVVDNKLVFTPGTDFDHLKAGVSEQVTLSYTMKDDQGATSTSSVVVTVTGTNDAPVAVADTASATENQTVSIDVLANDTDVDDGHVFTLVSGTAPEGKGTTSVVDNKLVFTPGTDFDHLKAGVSEQVTLSYTMKDDQGVESTSSVVVTVTGTNDAPVAVADTASGTENQALSIDVLANDTDADDGHVFTLVSGTGPEGKGATSVVDNKLVFTPGADFDHLKAGATEQVTLSYTMKDDEGVESTSSVVVTVTGTNDAPVAVADTASGTENQALNIDVLANDTDADDGHVFTLVSGTAPEGKGTTSVVDNKLVFTPGTDFDHLKAGATEQVTLNYTMKDDQGATSTSSVVVTVTGTNDAPVAVADTASATENQTVSIDVLANDTDADDGYVFTLVSGTAPANKGTVTVANNQLVFTPGTDFDHLKAGATEQVTLSYTMKDDQGVESTSSVVVTVTGTNDAPVAVADTASGTENQTLAIDVLANDTDADDGHVFTLVSGTAPEGKGTTSVVDNKLVFTPGTDFDHLKAGVSEQVTLNYTMKDDQGATSTSSVVVTVTGTNDAPVAVADTASGTENQALSIDVLANDTDADDGHVFTLVSGTAPANKGTVTVANNQLVFTPGADFDHLKAGATEQVTLSYTMKDDQGVESTSSVVVTVTGTNDAPVAVADTASGTENQALSIDVLANDTDVDDGHVFTLVSGTAPEGKGTTSVVDNQLVFTPGTDFDHLKAGVSEQVTLSYTMKDDQGVESTSSVVVTVTGTNDAPVAVADTASGTENQTLAIDVLANDTDVDDGHVFTLVSGTAPEGKGATSVVDNKLVFTPGTDFDHLKAGVSEQVTLSYTMKDDQGVESTSSVVVTVTGTNDAPVAVADTASATENQALSIDVLANDTDVDDGHVFTLVSGTAPEGKGTTSVVDNKLVFTPGTDFDHLKVGATEQVTLNYTMKDDQGATSTSSVVVTVTGTNDAPVAFADTASATENQTVSIDVLANDTDVDDGHVFTLVSGTAPEGKGTTSVVDNKLVFTPGTDFDHLKAGVSEQVTLSYTMKDDQGVESTSSVVVTVTGTNDAPVAVADTASGTENQALNIDVLANDTDADDGHVFTLVSGTAPANKGTTSVVDNKLVFTPGADFDHLKAGATEQVTLSYTMKDDQGVESTSSVVVTVTGTNDAPVAVADTASGTENQTLAIDVLANDTDADDGHVFTLVSGTAPEGKGTTSVVDNKLVFTPGTDFDHLKAGVSEQVTLNYTMKDDQGATSTSSVVVTVTGTNDAPVAVADTASGTENQALSIDVLANDTDADDGHVFTLVSGTAPASKGSVAVANNQLVFTPGADFDHLKAGATEQVTLSYTMKDDQGVESTSSVVVTVTGTNDAPVAVADTASGTENQALSIDVLANDTDVDDGHVFTLVSGTAPEGKGTTSVVDNQLVFTPGTDFDHLKAGVSEQVTLSYTMKDDQGVESTSSVVVTVTGTNDAPVAVADTASGTENQTLAIDVLANDTDVDDGHVFTLVSGTAPEGKGATSVVDNKLVFTPGTDFDHLKAGVSEQVTLSYTMKDDQGVESTSSVVVTVTGTNDAPVAVADTASATENQALSIDVLANDTDVDDGHVFTLVSGTAPEGKGTTSVVDNKLVFTPGTDFDHLKVGATEQVTLNYTMKDDQGATSTSSVVVTVTGTNDAPVAVADTASGTENQTLSIDVLANDTDADDGHVFTLLSGTAPANKGTVTVANNQLVFTPGADFDHLKAGVSEQVTLSYTMKDDQGATSTSSVVVTVTGTNDAPVAVADTASGTENQALNIDVLANDTDADDGHVFTLVSGTAPEGKGATSVVDNKLVFTPGTDFDHLKAGATEQVTLNYTMKDDQGVESTSSVVVTVTGTNDAPVAVADTASGTENQTLAIDVLANDTDVDDGHVFTLVSGTAPEGKGTTSVVDNKLVFTPGTDFDHLKAGVSEQVTLNYTMKDDQGVESTSSVVVTVTGTNDAPVAVADTASGTENQALSIDVLANDTDADDGHVFTLVSGTGPEGKGATSVVDNKLVFTPGADFDHLKAGATEQVTLSYTMKDDEGVESTSSVVVTVTGTNDAPVAVADTASGTENQALNIDVLANDTDADDGHVFTLVSGTAPEGKGTTSVVDNKLVFTPGTDFDHLKAGATEQVTLSYTMKDDQGVESTSSVVVTVTGTNDAPVAVADTASGTENQALSIDVLANDTDADDGHVFTLVSGTAPTSKGSVAVANNQLVFTPGADFDHLKAGVSEQVTLSYTMKDDQGVESTSSVVVTVTGTNDAPVAVADTASGTENQTLSIDVLANDTDADDGHVFTLLSGTAPANKGTVTVANNQLVFTPGADFDHLKAGVSEQVTLSYTMKDDQGATSTSSVVVTVTGTNDAPVAVADTASGTENQALNIDVLANDTDADDGHVFTLVSGTAPANKGTTSVVDNKLVFTPGADFDHLKAGATEQVTLSYTMKDDQGVESTSSVVVAVTGTNDAPVAVADTASGTENQALSIDVLANDTDADDGHVFTLVSGTAPASKGSVAVANNQLVFTPGADFDHLKAGVSEQVTLSYTMKDDQGVESTSSVVVTVTGTNDAPVAVADTASGTENQALNIDVLANDTDADDGHVFTLVSGTAPEGKGTTSVVDNKLVFTPGTDFDHLKAGATEQVTLSYTMKDDQGVESTSSVVVTVTGTNDAPVAVADTASGTENQALSIDVLANDTDADDGHVFTLVSGTAPTSKGSVAVANNQLVFTPGADFDHLKAGVSEQVTLSYTMKDDQGVESTSSVVVTVTGTNDAPVAVADTASGTENQTLSIDVLANDTDADDGHVFTLLSGTAPANKGTVTVANNQLVFTPGADFDHLKAGVSEQVTLSYTMKDDQGVESTSSVVVTVTGTNDAPVAVADTASGTENQALSIDVLANDTDADDGHVFTLLSGTAPANKGTVTVANNQLVFTPGADFDHLKAGVSEQVTLSYTMKDDQGATSTSSVVVTVTGTNDAPVAVADTASGTENQALNIDVLANDTDADDGHVFTLVSGTAPANKGTVTVANNQLVFTPGADFDHLKAGATEQVTLSYTMKDDQGATSTSSVVVTVTGTNDAPVAVADTASGTENQALNIDVLANDTDADDGHVFTLVSGTAPANKGTVTVANNQLVFTPGADFDHLKAGATEQVTLSYTMKDDQGATSTSSVVVTVTGTNDAPVAVADTASGTENQTVSIDVLANDTDADDGHVFTLVSGTAPANKGTVTVANNQLVFTPGTDFDHLKAGVSEQVTLSYTMKDDQGATSTSSVVVTITGTNDLAVIGNATNKDVTEDTALSGANLTASGSISITDADDGEATFTGAANKAGATNLGTLVLQTNGSYTYSVANSDVQYLGASDTKVDTFTVTSTDGTTKDVSFTIHGTNDAAVIGNATVTDVTEDAGVNAGGKLSATGSISITDVDSGQATFTGAADKAGVTNLGTLLLQADGSYTYSVANTAVQYLGASQTRVETFTLTTADGTTKDVSFTIHGVNDAATLSSDTRNLVETNSVLTTGGTLTVSDVDSPSTFQAQSNTVGTYGRFSIGANGVWTYATTTPHNEFVSGTTYKDTFQVLSADGTATSVTVNIAGTDETAVAITAISTDSGSSSTDFVTNDTSLTVSGSHGTLNAGEKIQVSIDGGANWSDVTTTSATTWSYTDPTIHATSFVYQVRVIDSTGGVGNTAAQAVTIDTTADASPAATLAVGDTLVNNTEKTAVSYAVAGLDSDATAVVTISDGTHTSTHTYAASGAFGFDLSGFNDGAITSSMVITDTAGNSTNVTGQSTTLDTTADAGAKATIVLNDGDGYINNAEKGAVSFTLSGVDSDATATVRFSDGNAAHDIVVTGLGNVTSTVNLATLTDGTVTASVSLSDTAGNLATGTSDTSVKDTTGPTLTSVARQNPASATTSADVLVFRVTFSETVSGVDAADFVVSGTTAVASAVTLVSPGVYDVTVSGGDLANLNGTVGLALKSTNGGATIQDVATNVMTNFAATGTTASYTVTNAAPDTTADAGATLRLTGVSNTTNGNTFSTITLSLAGFDSDLASAKITLRDASGHTVVHSLTSDEMTTVKSGGNDGSITIAANGTNWPGLTDLIKNDKIAVTIDVTDLTGNQANHPASFEIKGNGTVFTAPAGAAGEPIQLALSDPQDHAGLVTVNVGNLPANWTLSEGSRNADGTWTAQTSDPSKLTVTSPAGFSGAVPLKVSMQWTGADGTMASSQITDNVEVYAHGSPIFALSSDDNLTASSAADLLVFAQPIAHDTIYRFDTAADKIDLIGFTGVNGFSNLSIADDASGNAVITLANGSMITVDGVHAASLTANNFAFNVQPTSSNTGTLTIADGAIMPFGGVLNNSGTIALKSMGSDTRLEVLVESLTLKGGGHLTLSDNGQNVIVGGAANAKLVNIDNTISGAGQIGAGQMALDNHGSILADGSNALTIDTGANIVANAGTLASSGSGGLMINSALDNSGKLWANGGNLTVHGDVSGSGSAVISGASVLKLDGAAHLAVSFDAGGSGSLKLGDADHFSGSIAGFGGNDTLRLADIAVKAGSTLSFVADASGGTLTVGDGTSTAHLALLGSFVNAGFVATADQGGMLVTANVADAKQNLHGTDGMDLLFSGAGNDILVGGAGNDVLFGGGGSDTFVFDTALNGASNVDTILDFHANGDADYIFLSQKIFGSLSATSGTLDASQFAAVSDGSGASALLDAGVHLIYDSQTGSLYYDANGANTADGRTLVAVIGQFEHPSGTIVTHDAFKFG